MRFIYVLKTEEETQPKSVRELGGIGIKANGGKYRRLKGKGTKNMKMYNKPLEVGGKGAEIILAQNLDTSRSRLHAQVTIIRDKIDPSSS